MRFTSEQQAAIGTHDCNLIVTAGAGSGKTRVLVERFIALLDANPTWALPSVVAITFTEKAAREMRDRVHQALEARVEVAIAEGDADTLQRWLDCEADLTRARIGTIHSLCASVLRANPAEAGLDPQFSVLDENDSAMLLEDAVEEALAELGAQPGGAYDLLRAYDLRQARAVLGAFAGHGMAADVRARLDLTPEALCARWETLWRGAANAAIAALRADTALWDALDWVAPDDLPPGDKLSDIWRAVWEHAAGLQADDPARVIAACAALGDTIKLNVGSAKNWNGKEMVAEAKAQLSMIRDKARAAVDSVLPPLTDRDDEAARWLMQWAEAIQVAARVYAEMKQERSALDFDDLEARACALLCDHPAVAARYQREFRHILVDEFQDTNDAQRRIVYALAGLDRDRDGVPDQPLNSPGGRLFVVGDPKQSIYAFRGADVRVFNDVRADIRGGGGGEVPLSMSFRTQSRLVEAFNYLFAHILQPETGAAAQYAVALDQPMQAFRPAEEFHECPVTVFAFQKEPLDQLDPPPVSTTAALREWEAVTLAHHIHDMVAAQTPVFDRERSGYRPLGYGDVAILFQSMSKVPAYEDAFKAAGLPYVTVAGKGYFDRQEVWDLLNLLGALYNPADDLALAAALRSPLFGLSDHALLVLRAPMWRADRDRSLRAHERRSLWDELHDESGAYRDDLDAVDRRACDFARAVLRDLSAVAGRATIAELLTRVLDLTGYLATLTGLPDGERRRGNVEKLVALARRSGRVSLGAFTAYARELTAREVREGEAVVEVEDAVKLMSVHASKGLEFPVVVLADAAWTRSHRDGSPFVLDPDIGAACKLPVFAPEDADAPDPFAYAYAAQLAERRDRAERKRLLYVGATRAQDYLIVSGMLYRCSDHAWLKQVLDALAVDDDLLLPSDTPQYVTHAWGSAAIIAPQTVQLVGAQPGDAATGASGWDGAAVRAGQPIPGVLPDLPPLVAPVPVAADAPARSLSATHLAALGRAPFYDPASSGPERVRQVVLHDTPDPVRPLPERVPTRRQLRRIVGQMVHRALQTWALPDRMDDADLRARLHAYAWDAQLSDLDLAEDAIGYALELLDRFTHSDLCARLDAARQVYRELPFMWQHNGRTLHGVIDVLFEDDRGWTVLDYKTAPVSAHYAAEHARRHYLQLGVYARAAEAQIGQRPHTLLYYVHPGQAVHVTPAQWAAALDGLESGLRAALE